MRSKLLWFFILLICVGRQLLAQAPAWQWAKEANSAQNEKAWDVSWDPSSGNIYTAGTFNGNLNSAYGLSLSSSYGQSDGFLAKYDPQGNVLWALKIGGSNVEEIKSVAADPSGNVYVAGYFRGICDFDPSANTYTLSPSGGAGFQDGFLAKYDGLGNFLWAAKFGNLLMEDVWRIFADANGIYITGNCFGSVTFNSASPSVVTKTIAAGQGFSEFYGVKYDAAGVVQWAISGTSQKDDYGYDVVADNNNVYFIGTYEKDMDLYNANGTFAQQLLVASNNNSSIFVAAFTQSTGTLAWASGAGSVGSNDTGNGITQDNTDLYITGTFMGTVNFPIGVPLFTKTSSGNRDMFVAKLSKSTGTFQWLSAQTCTGSGDEAGYEADLDASGNIIVAGYFNSGITFTAGPSFSTSGNEDILISAYSPAGNFLWASKAGANNADVPYGLASSTTGAVYVAGQHANATVFGTTTLSSGNGENIFIAKTGCEAVGNNTIASSQTVCVSATPALLTGSAPTGVMVYAWEQSTNSQSWNHAFGTYTNQVYAPATLTTDTYYRRRVSAGTACTNASSSNTILITVNALPALSAAGSAQTLCASSPTTVMSANIPTVGTGSWSVIAGSGSLVSPGLATSAVTALGPGTNVLKWTISNGVCAPSSSTVMIQVDNLPSAPVAGTNQTLCINSPSANLAANLPAVGAGLWTVQSGGAVIAAPAQPVTVVAGLSAGINVLAWTISNGVCAPLTSTKTIQVDHMPTPASAGSNQTVCVSTVSVDLNGNVPIVGFGSWAILSGNGLVASSVQPGSSVSSLGTGINVFQWTITNGLCPASSASVAIQADAVPSAPLVSNNQTVCASSLTAVLAANSPLVGTGVWTTPTGGVLISAPASATTTATGLATGINVFVWTISNGVCTALSATQTIQADQLPDAALAGGAQTLCISSPTAVLNANVPAVGVGSWSLIAGSGSIISPALATTAVTSLGQGINILGWTIGNGICPSSSSTLTIQVDDLPTTPIAGANQTLCVNSASTNLAANIPAVGTGSWSVQNGGGIFASPSLPLTAVTSLSPGINVLGWTITNGVCAPLTSTKTIQVDQMPAIASAGSGQTLCASSPSAVLSGNAPTVGTGSWSGLSGSGVISSPSQPGSLVTSLSTGTNILQWTISNGVCPASSATVAIRVDAVPTTPVAGSNQTLCVASPTATLSGNLPLTGIGLWTVQNGSAVIANPSSPTTTATGFVPGLTLFAWTISNGVCAPLTSTKTVQTDALPDAAVAGPSQTLCVSTPSVVLGANAPAIGTGSWSVLSGGATIATPTSPVSAIMNILPGMLVLKWETGNGICPISSATTGVQVDALPTIASAGNNAAICAASASLSANTPAVGTGSWSLVQGSGQLAQPLQPTTPVTALSSGQNKFAWTVINGSCAPSVDTVTITRDLNPDAAMAGSDTLICGASFILMANDPVHGTGQWNLLSGTGNIANGLLFSTPVTSLGTGDNVFVWKISNGSCAPSYDTVIVKTNTPPSAALAGTNQRVCAATVTLSSNAPLVGTGSWSIVEGNAQIQDTLLNNTRMNLPDTNAVTLRWTVKNGICADSESEVTIKRDMEPDQAFAGIDQQVETPVARLSAQQPSVGAGHWQVLQGDATISDAAKATALAESLSTGNNVFRWTVENGVCPVKTDDIIIYLEPLKIPTGFSPNNDNINDTYVIPGLDYYAHADFSVFNRWGAVVYHNTSYKNEWTGTNQHNEPLADDTYYFTLKISATMDYSGYIIIKTTK